jgi:hypothetical protein
MPKFGANSQKHLGTLHPDLQKVMVEAIKHFDFAITCGHRGKDDQDKAVAEGKSQTKWPTSKHNSLPSRAVDVAPYVNGIQWNDIEGFTLLAGIIKGIAVMMGVNLRIGVDWDGDLLVMEHGFKDRPHIELV